MNCATSTSGDQVPWGRAGPDYLCDTGSKSCGSHHQSRHGCFSVPRRPLNLYLQTGGTKSPPVQKSFNLLFLRRLFSFLPSALLLTECDPHCFSVQHEVDLSRKECPFVIKPKIQRPTTATETEDMDTDMDS